RLEKGTTIDFRHVIFLRAVGHTVARVSNPCSACAHALRVQLEKTIAQAKSVSNQFAYAIVFSLREVPAHRHARVGNPCYSGMRLRTIIHGRRRANPKPATKISSPVGSGIGDTPASE